MLLRVIQQSGDRIRFIRGEEEGVLCWYYLRLDPAKTVDFEQALQEGGLEVRRYGTVLESAAGLYPPADVIRFMQSEFGVDTPVQS